jgi:hypothetical protein
MTRPNESGGGGMTGSTGDLTPDDADRPFIPAELREISSPESEDVPDEGPERVPERVAGGTPPGDSDGDVVSDHDEHF